MSIEQHVVSLELAKKMKEMGFPQDSLFKYVAKIGYSPREYVTREMAMDAGDLSYEGAVYKEEAITDYEELIMLSESIYDEQEICAAPLASELGEWLPEYNDLIKKDGQYTCTVSMEIHDNPDFNYMFHQTESNTEANARAKMLIWLVENGYLDVNSLKEKKE